MNIEQLRAATTKQDIWDDKVKGLHLRVREKGFKSFYVFYRTKAGVQRRPKLGNFGDITLAEARKRAKDILDMVAAGADPKGDWNISKAELTVDNLYHKVLNDYWDKPRFRQSDRLRDVKSLYARHIKDRFGSYKLSALRTAEVREWHAALSGTPVAANRAMEVLSRLYSYAEETGLRPLGQNPCALVPANREKKRGRFATPTEIQKIGTILAREFEANPNGVTFLYLLLVSGSRPRLIERAMPDQLQTMLKDGIRYGILCLAGKATEATGENDIVIIPPQGMDMIDRCPRQTGGTLTDTKMPRALWERIRTEVGCPDLWARDFRRTFATVGLSSGVNLSTISELLNHKSTQTTKVYAKLMDDKRVTATLAIANKIDSMVGASETVIDITPNANVQQRTDDDRLSAG